MNHTKNKEYKKNQYSFKNGTFPNGFPILFPKQANKNTKFRIIHSSDKSTINTISNLSTDNCCNGNNHNCANEIFNDDVENIGKKINDAFEVLEKLILIDKENTKEEMTNNDSSTVSPADDKTDLKSNKKCHTIAIPKLDFSDIFDYYENTPVYIRKIKIRKTKKNGANLKYSDKNINKLHHHKHYSHSVIKE